MDRLKILLEENQWSRPSPSLTDPETNERVRTCPICTAPQVQGHDKECWLGQAIKLHEQEAQSAREQTSRLHGLKVNRDALFEENKRFRSVVVTDVEIIKELNQTLKELKSMHEGKMEAAHEIIIQLELQITLADAAKQGLRIEIVQQAGKIYFWALMHGTRHLAHSRSIAAKDVIEPEADKLAAALGLPVIMNERK